MNLSASQFFRERAANFANHFDHAHTVFAFDEDRSSPSTVKSTRPPCCNERFTSEIRMARRKRVSLACR